tara:strand:+ start:748 stop:1830 length:1083 start_codon:yes stop_codon:yes gene_type:complete
MNNYETIEITKEDFLPYLHWCLIKFQIDPSSRRGIGGVNHKIGGFIDRFSNQCVNWIIFNHLLRNEKFKVDPDYFFYREKSAKKCADIIGLKGENGKVVPLTYFNKTEWVHINNAPFIEVKTLRKDQQIAHLGMTQYRDNNYFVYVESDFDELYLFNLIEGFLEKDFDMSMNEIYVKDNSDNVLLSSKVERPNKIATIRLMGTYKGADLKEHNLEFPMGKNPRYIGSIEKVNEKDTINPNKRIATKITDERFIYDPWEEKLNEWLPIYTKANSIQMIHKERKTKGYLFIEVEEPCFLNEHHLEKGFYKINFKILDRSGKETEIFNHKSVYDNVNHNYPVFPDDRTDELIQELKLSYYAER